ncbi:hypothetical protein POJ06DRAFT_295299 [Lipomyces tetrasporus]|uniref:Uncharacterized protein n=1 Tax=Lipomyces tetrasporus TaxID=54092 RepID=A0AAD7QUY0_9ASCO|nr:uncharacterized protein POJ06DRAFT_295299 [Lipomyces tetrasporus]KAJ8100202.1 hypothetical protein POJ06DRAFT_295299 [Lipomyces tetrasporus]
MDQSEVALKDSNYCRKCASCRTWIRCEALHVLQQMFVSIDGQPLKSCKRCRDNVTDSEKPNRGPKRAGFDLDEYYETHEEFVEPHDNHKFDAALQSLRIEATLSSTFLIENDISVAITHKAETASYRNDMFDCTGYYFHLRRIKRPDGRRFNLSCSRSIEPKTERDPLSIRRYTAAKEFFECQGELHISFSKVNESAMVVYEHNYIEAQKRLPPRQIYQNLLQMADEPQIYKTEFYTITMQQVYNVWLSLTKTSGKGRGERL